MSNKSGRMTLFSPAAQAKARQEAETPAVPERSEKPKAPDRRSFAVTPQQARQIKLYCADAGITLQQLVIDGINRVLASEGLPPLSED